VLQQLRRLLGALSVGRPFVRENADRLRRLGWVLIVVELALATLRMAEGPYVAWQFERPGLELWPFRLYVPVSGLFVGAVCWSSPRRSGAAPSWKRTRRSPSEGGPCRSSAVSTACCWSGR
jgi:hypothetical protein